MYNVRSPFHSLAFFAIYFMDAKCFAWQYIVLFQIFLVLCLARFALFLFYFSSDWSCFISFFAILPCFWKYSFFNCASLVFLSLIVVTFTAFSFLHLFLCVCVCVCVCVEYDWLLFIPTSCPILLIYLIYSNYISQERFKAALDISDQKVTLAVQTYETVSFWFETKKSDLKSVREVPFFPSLVVDLCFSPYTTFKRWTSTFGN